MITSVDHTNRRQENAPLRRQHITIAKSGARIHTDHWLPSNLDPRQDFTQSPDRISLVDHGLLMGEEDLICINGKPTAAFYIHGCPLRCTTCYQPEFFAPKGIVNFSLDELVAKVQEYQLRGASSLSIVIGTAQPLVTRFLDLLKAKNISIPVVYNYSGLLSVSALTRLEKCVDIFVPDLKALSKELCEIHGLSNDYPRIASQGIKYLCENTEKKVVMRHLLVPSYPSYKEEALRILDWAGSLKRPPVLSFLVNYYDKAQKGIVSTPKSVREELIDYGNALNISVLAH